MYDIKLTDATDTDHVWQSVCGATTDRCTYPTQYTEKEMKKTYFFPYREICELSNAWFGLCKLKNKQMQSKTLNKIETLR